LPDFVFSLPPSAKGFFSDGLRFYLWRRQRLLYCPPSSERRVLVFASQRFFFDRSFSCPFHPHPIALPLISRLLRIRFIVFLNLDDSFLRQVSVPFLPLETLCLCLFSGSPIVPFSGQKGFQRAIAASLCCPNIVAASWLPQRGPLQLSPVPFLLSNFPRRTPTQCFGKFIPVFCSFFPCATMRFPLLILTPPPPLFVPCTPLFFIYTRPFSASYASVS